MCSIVLILFDRHGCLNCDWSIGSTPRYGPADLADDTVKKYEDKQPVWEEDLKFGLEKKSY